ncbi:hypothetical protein Ancab_036025 [Ancistrocladus abbreviatus]
MSLLLLSSCLKRSSSPTEPYQAAQSLTAPAQSISKQQNPPLVNTTVYVQPSEFLPSVALVLSAIPSFPVTIAGSVLSAYDYFFPLWASFAHHLLK